MLMDNFKINRPLLEQKLNCNDFIGRNSSFKVISEHFFRTEKGHLNWFF